MPGADTTTGVSYKIPGADTTTGVLYKMPGCASIPSLLVLFMTTLFSQETGNYSATSGSGVQHILYTDGTYIARRPQIEHR